MWMKLLMKKVWDYIKIRGWFLALLVFSTLYVWYYRFDIYQLEKINAQNLIFILWLILLLLPLFSEMEFLGIKVKKEVKKATEEVKSSLHNIQTQISQMQMTNSVANNISLSNSILPSEQKLEELLESVKELQERYPKVPKVNDDKINKEVDNNVYLFKVRLEIEISLRELCEKIGFMEKKPIIGMLRILNRTEIVDNVTCELISQVNKIANRGVHGEIVSKEYLMFVEKTYPEIIRQLDKAALMLKDNVWSEMENDE